MCEDSWDFWLERKEAHSVLRRSKLALRMIIPLSSILTAGADRSNPASWYMITSFDRTQRQKSVLLPVEASSRYNRAAPFQRSGLLNWREEHKCTCLCILWRMHTSVPFFSTAGAQSFGTFQIHHPQPKQEFGCRRCRICAETKPAKTWEEPDQHWEKWPEYRTRKMTRI